MKNMWGGAKVPIKDVENVGGVKEGGRARGGEIRASLSSVGGVCPWREDPRPGTGGRGGLTPGRGDPRFFIGGRGGSCPWREDPRPGTAGRGGSRPWRGDPRPVTLGRRGGQSREGIDEVPQEPSSESEISILRGCCTPLEANCAQSEGRTQGGGGSLTYTVLPHSPRGRLCHICGVGAPPGARACTI